MSSHAFSPVVATEAGSSPPETHRTTRAPFCRTQISGRYDRELGALHASGYGQVRAHSFRKVTRGGPVPPSPRRTWRSCLCRTRPQRPHHVARRQRTSPCRPRAAYATPAHRALSGRLSRSYMVACGCSQARTALACPAGAAPRAAGRTPRPSQPWKLFASIGPNIYRQHTYDPGDCTCGEHNRLREFSRALLQEKRVGRPKHNGQEHPEVTRAKVETQK